MLDGANVSIGESGDPDGANVCAVASASVGNNVGAFDGRDVGWHESSAVNVAKVPNEAVSKSELAARLDANF